VESEQVDFSTLEAPVDTRGESDGGFRLRILERAVPGVATCRLIE